MCKAINEQDDIRDGKCSEKVKPSDGEEGKWLVGGAGVGEGAALGVGG